MIVYKVNIKIKKEKEEVWLQWMAKTHIPDVINTGHFVDFTFGRLIKNGKVDYDFSTYEIQYHCKNINELETYQNIDAPKLQEAYKNIFGDVTEATRSIYEDITEEEFVEAGM